MTASAIESESFGIVSSRGGTASVLELAGGQLGRERRGEPGLAHPLELARHLAARSRRGRPRRHPPPRAARGGRRSGRAPSTGRARPRGDTRRDRCASGRRSGTSAPRRTPARRPRGHARRRAAAASRTVHTLIPSIVSAGTLHDLGACADLARGHRAERRVLAVAVVLADEDERQLEDLREVEALEDVALVHRAVAEGRDRDAARRPLQRERRPGRRRDAAADDPERADQPVRRAS